MSNSRMSLGDLKRSGFTLVELLVVITIMGTLVSMLLPAVNSARESGRNLQCKNNLMQMGRACIAHEEAQGIFPTGGWGWYWVGDPDCGYGDQQPGGWIYNILPHTEMNNLHDLGKTPPGLTPNNSTKQAAILQMVSTALPFTNCPTRRREALYPQDWGTNYIAHNSGGVTSPAGTLLARTDYAVNVGDVQGNEIGAGPASNSLSDQASYFNSRKATNPQTYHGISFEQSTIRKDDITSGLSTTLLAGEKYLGADNYGTGNVAADNENEYVGFDNDIGRNTYKAPMQDRWGVGDSQAFGSAHPNGANFVLCDGSTVTINYSVDPPTFLLFGQRSNRASTLNMTLLLGAVNQ